MDMGKHVAIKKGMGATAPQPFDRPELNHGVSSYAAIMNNCDESTN